MKRRITKLVVLLLLGAIVNVAVAWGCAVWSGTNPEYSSGSNLADIGFGPTPVSKQVRKFHELHLPSELKIFNEVRSSELDFGYEVYAIISLETAQHFLETAAIHGGWPASSLASYYSYYYHKGDSDAGMDSIIEEWESGILFVVGENRWIPVRPMWPGFVTNTIFYAALLWIPFAPFQLRRYLRIKRGHCIKCGYDLRGTSGGVCPECGATTR